MIGAENELSTRELLVKALNMLLSCMANRRWLNDRKTMGFESSKKSVNIRVHDAFFLLFFYFFYQASASPPARRRETALDSARPYPLRNLGVPFSCASRLRCWTRRNRQNRCRMLQNASFVAFIGASLGRFHASSTPANTPETQSNQRRTPYTLTN